MSQVNLPLQEIWSWWRDLAISIPWPLLFWFLCSSTRRKLQILSVLVHLLFMYIIEIMDAVSFQANGITWLRCSPFCSTQLLMITVNKKYAASWANIHQSLSRSRANSPGPQVDDPRWLPLGFHRAYTVQCRCVWQIQSHPLILSGPRSVQRRSLIVSWQSPLCVSMYQCYRGNNATGEPTAHVGIS